MRSEAIKSTARDIVARAYYTRRRHSSRLKGKVLILTYHRILHEEAPSGDPVAQAGMYVGSKVFERQIGFLKDHFSVLSFAELLQHWKEQTLNRDKCHCVITFDDGWLDNYLHAFPILQRYEVPATIFLPTAMIGTDRWFWPDKIAYLLNRCFSGDEVKGAVLSFVKSRYPWLGPLPDGKQAADIDAIIETCKGRSMEEVEKLLDEMGRSFGVSFPERRVLVDWQEVEEMSRHRISFGSHSSTHRIFTTLSQQQVQEEAAESLGILRSKDINCVPVMAYPNGNYNDDIQDWIETAGYQAAVTTQFGFEELAPRNLFALNRIGIHHDITATLPLFWFHIAGGNHLFC